MSRLLFINNVYPTAECPRMGSYAQTMAECLVKAGHEVSVEAMLYHRPRVGALDKVKQYAAFWRRLRSLDLSGYDTLYINHFTYCFPVLFNPTLQRVGKVYIHWHGKELVASSTFNRVLVKALGKRLRNYRHIAPSEFFKRRILKAAPLDAESVAVSPSGGVDTTLFSPGLVRRGADTLMVGFPGEIKTTKGADVLLKVMGEHRKIEEATGMKPLFRVIAYGPQLERYVKAFGETGARFEVVPKMTKAEMAGFFRPLDVALVLSSAVIGESLGLVALEAMGCGVPVIAHDICAFPEFVVPGVSGELAPYSGGDVAARAAAVVDKIIAVCLRREAYNPRRIVRERYSQDSVVEYYKTL